MNIWVTVLTSAAVGVLVSGLITLLGQYLERSARRKELLLTKALEMAIRKSDLLMKTVEVSGGRATLLDEVITSEIYLRWLESLLKSGKLPPEAEKFRKSE